RTEKPDFDYWLQIVELLGEKSPMLIFHNEKKGRVCDTNLDGIRQSFGHFLSAGEYRANLDSVGQGKSFDKKQLDDFTSFRDELIQNLQKLPIVGIPIEKSWISVRKKIETLAKKNPHIPVEKLWRICSENEVTLEQDQKDLSQLFHDLGIFLHYQKSEDEITSPLNNIVILQNDWATKAVYMVLKSEWLQKEKTGHFTLSDLCRVWEGTDYEKHSEELLELMKKFELCYQVENSLVYIAPQLLPASPPKDYVFPNGEVSLLRFSYDFMPKGIITRLTVRMHLDIARNQTLAWKDGFVLEKYGSTAEVIETYGKREIHIKAKGENRRKLINEIAIEINKINSQYHFSSRIESHMMLPCTCVECKDSDEPYFFKYQEIKKFKAKGRTVAPCGKSGEEALISDLLSIILEGKEKEYFETRWIETELRAMRKNQVEIKTEIEKLTEQIKESNKSILNALENSNLDEEKLAGLLKNIWETLEPLKGKVSEIENAEKELKTEPDIKGKFKITWALIPKVLENPLLPNIVYEKEIAWNLEDLTRKIISDFKKGEFFKKKDNSGKT
ncbi:MAG TPA: COR domain-containing protein, partial [Saprospiraceae bacterium]|nr:COR domain-containing protein [Saprospiraceae bacterium]